MLRQVWFIGRKDMKYMLRERESIIWMFVMPIVFFYFIGTVTGGFASRGGSQDRLALWQDGDTGFLGDQLRRRLEERQYQITTPPTRDAFDAAPRRLRIPAGFTDSVLAARPVTLQFVRDEGGLGGDYSASASGAPSTPCSPTSSSSAKPACRRRRPASRGSTRCHAPCRSR